MANMTKLAQHCGLTAEPFPIVGLTQKLAAFSII